MDQSVGQTEGYGGKDIEKRCSEMEQIYYGGKYRRTEHHY